MIAGVLSVTSKASTTVVQECVHHWMLPSPGGQMTTGICKRCGEEKQFVETVVSGWGPRRGAKKK